MSISVLNTNANLSGKTVVAAENADTITGLKTFSRGAAVPFAVAAASLKVTNLDADKLDGEEGTAYHSLVNATNWATGSLAWQVWTPTWTNLSVGNGSVIARYAQVGKLVFYNISLTFGTTTSISGGVSVNYPVNATAASMITGTGVVLDSSASKFFQVLTFLVSTSSQTFLVDYGAADGSLAGITASAPFVWTTSDGIFVSGLYEAA
jgi:hypothetical protein